MAFAPSWLRPVNIYTHSAELFRRISEVADTDRSNLPFDNRLGRAH